MSVAASDKNAWSEPCDDVTVRLRSEEDHDVHLEDASSGMVMLQLAGERYKLTNKFQEFLENEQFADVFLTGVVNQVASSNDIIKAHKVVLAASSEYFRCALLHIPVAQHPLIQLDIPFEDLQNIVKCIYEGKVSMEGTSVDSFLNSAMLLQVEVAQGTTISFDETDEEPDEKYRFVLPENSNQENLTPESPDQVDPCVENPAPEIPIDVKRPLKKRKRAQEEYTDELIHAEACPVQEEHIDERKHSKTCPGQKAFLDEQIHTKSCPDSPLDHDEFLLRTAEWNVKHGIYVAPRRKCSLTPSLSGYAMSAHSSPDVPVPFKCQYCPQRFRSNADLYFHIDEMHELEGDYNR